MYICKNRDIEVVLSTYAHFLYKDIRDSKLHKKLREIIYKENEIIEIGLIPFEYSVDGRIFKVHDAFNQFQEPSEPIPDEITKITGITNNMVSGHEIDKESVTEIIKPASFAIAATEFTSAAALSFS